MSMSGEEIIQQATAELRRQQADLMAARAKLEDASTKVTSKDRMVTVVLDMRGQVGSITFHSQKFRRIAPAELGSILVETITRAQEECRERVMRAYRPFVPSGLNLRDMMAGKTDLNKMFEDAIREADEMMPGGTPGPRNTRSAKEGKS
jgi:DNA-binding protein YbaB